jgi:pimeloyl-ACP methyl ester carboxylesterase
MLERPVRALPGGEALDLSWPSGYQALHPLYAETQARCPENAVCQARWFRHQGVPAPALICLHGWGAGRFALEERAYPVSWLYRKGFDVLLATLPFHARRAPRDRRTPMFPSTDPVRTNEGFAQAVLDLRELVLWLRQRGAPAVCLTGMSLGGFTSALVATVEPALEAVIPIIPFASLPELLWQHGAGTPAQQRALSAGIDLSRFSAAFAATTPLLRRPILAPGRMLVVGGERDRVTPLRHAERLAQHFQGSELLTFPGAHLLQVGRGQVFRAMGRFLGQAVGEVGGAGGRSAGARAGEGA